MDELGFGNTLWVEKYRPTTVNDIILPDDIKQQLKGFVKSNDMPNLVLSSVNAGVGKTTAARCLCNDLGYDVLFINASLEGNIDTLRNKMTAFVSSVSLTGNKKCVLLDESDGLNAQSTQPSLRAFLEKFSKNCRFIFTCNYINKLIPPLLSRCTVIDFNFKQGQKAELAKQTLIRLFHILENEHIKYDKAAVARLLMDHYPDIRRTINDLQRYSISGEIDAGILINNDHGNFNQLVEMLKAHQFTEMRKWVSDNKELPSEKIFRWFYDHSKDVIEQNSLPQFILTTADYMYKNAFVVDTEINIAAYLTEMMAQCAFKK